MLKLKEFAIRYSTPSIKAYLVTSPNSTERVHELISLSRDPLVLSVLSLHTPYEKIQLSLFDRFTDKSEKESLRAIGLISLSNNQKSSIPLLLKIADFVDQTNENIIKSMINYEFDFLNASLNSNSVLKSPNFHGLGFTTLVALSTEISPDLQQKIISDVYAFTKKRKHEMFYVFSNMQKDTHKSKYFWAGKSIYSVIEALTLNTELNHYSKELLYNLKKFIYKNYLHPI